MTCCAVWSQGFTPYFTFTSDQFSGLHYLVIPGTLKEGPYLLAGLLEQQTSLHPREIMTDTASYSDQLFGLFWLLGYQFSPRLAEPARHGSGGWIPKPTTARSSSSRATASTPG